MFSITGQGTLFLSTVLIGALIGFFYDIFRIIRMVFKHPNFLVQIEDVLYWLIATFLTFYLMLHINSGEIRIYIILGAFFGMAVYFFTLSIFIIKTSDILITFFKKVFFTIVAIVFAPIKLVLSILRIILNFFAKPIKKGKLYKDIKIILRKV